MARKLFIILPAIFIQQHLISTGVQDEHANTLGFLSRTTWWLIRRTEEGMASFCGAHVPDLRSLPSSSRSPRTRGRVARGCSSSMAPKRGAPAPPISLPLGHGKALDHVRRRCERAWRGAQRRGSGVRHAGERQYGADGGGKGGRKRGVGRAGPHHVGRLWRPQPSLEIRERQVCASLPCPS